MTTGLVIGKFYPPHEGHHYLIRTARAQVDRLIVMLCVHRDQTIPGDLRQAWLKEIHPDCEIVSVPDELPEDPYEWGVFTLKLFESLGWHAPDVVFSSEDYGEPFAAFMNARHVMVDSERQTVRVSGTAIRSAPLDHLEYLEPCVRAYFVKRVVLVGAESTGKTTLAQRLAETFETEWVSEYGREYWEARLAAAPRSEGEDLLQAAEAMPWTSSEFVHIAEEQQRREDAAAGRANRVLICDTNAFATGIWHERYKGFRYEKVDAIGARDIAHLYLLTVPDFPFVQDGLRDGEHIREWMHRRFVDALQDRPHVRIAGSESERFAQAKGAINGLLSASR